MSHVGELLDLAATGDERGLKRAYARLLKQARPDEDPAGFQRLHDAYQRALSMCRAGSHDSARIGVMARAPVDDGDASIDVLSQVPAPAFLQQATSAPQLDASSVDLPPQPDATQVLAAILQQGGQAQDAFFPNWLRQQSQAWSLDTRDAIAAGVLKALRQDDIAMRDSNLAALYALFGWDQLTPGIDALELNWLARRAYAAWLQQPSQHAALSALLTSNVERRPGTSEIAGMLDTLQHPRPHLRNLLSTFKARRTAYILRILEVLGWDSGMPPPKGIDAGQAYFWMAVETPTHRFRLQSRLLRSLSISAILLVTCALLQWGIASNSIHISSEDMWSAAAFLAGALFLPPFVTLINFMQLRLYAYQGADESEPVQYPWLRICFIPLAVGAAALVWPLLTYSPVIFLSIGWPLAWKILRLAQIRFRHRRGASLDVGAFMLFWMMVSVCLVAPALVGAMIYWLLDLLRHGRVLRWKATVNG